MPDNKKDEKYWQHRKRNNLAAKRSRDARRELDKQISIRLALLEKEVGLNWIDVQYDVPFKKLINWLIIDYVQNDALKAEVAKLTELYATALDDLAQCEKANGNKTIN